MSKPLREKSRSFQPPRASLNKLCTPGFGQFIPLFPGRSSQALSDRTGSVWTVLRVLGPLHTGFGQRPLADGRVARAEVAPVLSQPRASGHCRAEGSNCRPGLRSLALCSWTFSVFSCIQPPLSSDRSLCPCCYEGPPLHKMMLPTHISL